MQKAGEEEADAQRPQGRNANGQHIFRRIEQQQHLVGDHLHDEKTQQHHSHGADDGQFDGPGHPILFAGAIIVGNDGNHAVVQAENRHEDDALQLEIDAEYSRGRGDEG